jgi:hypothetical protein
MKVILEVDLDDEERKAIARDADFTPGQKKFKSRKANLEECKIFLAEVVAAQLDEYVESYLGTRNEREQRRGAQEVEIHPGHRVSVPLSWRQQEAKEES